MAERTFVALDLETTGLDSRRDAIIEIGAIRFRGDTILDRLVTFVDPQRPIPLQVQQITGIDDRTVAGAPTLAAVAPELLAFVNADVHAVIAHNVSFDLGFLQAAGIHFHRPALDTYELATILLPGLKSYNLGELCRELDIALSQAHRALADAEATMLLFRQIQSRIQRLPRSIVQLLVACGAESKWSPLHLLQDRLAAPLAPDEGTTVFPLGKSSKAPRLHPGTLDGVGPVRAIEEAAVVNAFDADGPLARQMEGRYERRQSQVTMARLVTSALNQGAHQIIEAGTGTGKSMAYLLPAALWAVTNQRRVIIATDTITLQEQLLEQEIPRLQQMMAEIAPHLPAPRVALLKGRSHYLCLRRLHAWCSGRSLSVQELRLLARILVWLPATTTGDVSELSLYDAQERMLWQQFASDNTSCTAERCGASAPAPANFPAWDGWSHFGPLGDSYLAAKEEAQHAHLLIVNHALLMADLQSNGRLLPEFDHLIIDEAHRLEQAATEQLTYRVDRRQIERMLRRLQLPDEAMHLLERNPEWHKLARQLDSQVRRLLPVIQNFHDSLQRVVLRQPEVEEQLGQAQRVDLEMLRPQPRWSQVELEWDSIRSDLRRLERLGCHLAEALEQARWWQQEPEATILVQIQHSCTELAEMDSQFAELIFQAPGRHTESVSWLEVSAENELTFCVAPIHVGEVLESHFFRSRRSVILTGATLRTDEGFEFMQERLGCLHATATAIESPFDYRTNVLLYLPSDIPMPDQSGYQAAVERAIIQTARAANGRTLVLFTSHAHLHATADAIRLPLDQAGINVLEHGVSSRNRLLREFRSGRKAVLLGTGTFWEGVDLPGQMLSCLIIVRLPFAVPTDPLVAARSRFYENPFYEYTIPDAVLRLRQGFGRLIRRADDRGVVMLLDSRAWRKSYGAAFLDALPTCTIRHAPLMNVGETASQWLADEPWLLPDGFDSHAAILRQ
jgi:ATP-dependent DNA helicase DinG